MDPKPDDPLEFFATPEDFERWLRKHHAKASCIWVKYAKKKSGIPSIDWDQAVDVALCYGWIDGQSRSEGDKTWLQKYTPRTKRSIWSKINREKVQALIEIGEMRPAGLAEIERAKKDGRWDAAYDSSKTITVPDDLQKALNKNKKAKAFFEKLDSRNRYAVLFRTHGAKKQETRERRIKQFVEMLERGEKIYP